MTFQTPPEVVEYMCSMIPKGTISVLEPTPGEGNIVSILEDYDVTAPENFFDLQQNKFDCIIMNPPFSSKYAFGVPDTIQEKGMKIGYYILFRCMEMSNHVIALMPWFLILDSSVRLKILKDYGLKSITALPRSTFEYARIQCCIFELERGYKGITEFRIFEFKKRRLKKGQIE
jgi:type I restriction-modification system DNA methylase subunit